MRVNALPARRTREGAFTLLELLIVIGVIGILAVAIVPAVNTLSKSQGRKGGVTNLLGAVEQARSEAIKSGRLTYLAFVTFTGGTAATIEKYNFKSYAIFQDDPADPTKPKQLSNWKILPTGVALRTNVTTLPEASAFNPPITMTFTPDASAGAKFYCVQFNLNGEVETPATDVTLTIFEGYVDGSGSEIATSAKASGQPTAIAALKISRLTGRGTYVTP